MKTARQLKSKGSSQQGSWVEGQGERVGLKVRVSELERRSGAASETKVRGSK